LTASGVLEHLALAQLLGHRAARQLQHRHQLGALGRAQALDALQVVGAGVQQAGDAAKPFGWRGQQFGGQLQHALARMPVRSSSASSSASLSAPGPRASSFSRGCASVGRSLSGMGGPGGAGFLQWRPVYRDFHGNCSTGFFPDPALPPGRARGRHHQHLRRQAGHPVAGLGRAVAGGRAAPDGLEEGVRATFELPPGEAFGERKADMVQWVARKLLDALGDPQEQYAVGDVVQFPRPMARASTPARCARCDDGSVLFDFNHPLASQPFDFNHRWLANG
jgi:hypothetical protein